MRSDAELVAGMRCKRIVFRQLRCNFTSQFRRQAATYVNPGELCALRLCVRRELPVGTAISVEPSEAHAERQQRFWLALLPEFPIASRAEWAICPAPCAGPGDRVVAAGHEFVLVRRGGAEPAAR